MNITSDQHNQTIFSSSLTNPLVQVQQLRKQLGDNGFLPVPIKNSEKKPLIKDWPKLAAKGKFIDVPADFDHLGTGILCNGLRVVDVDIEDTELSEHVLKSVRDRLGFAPMRYRSNSGKFILLYRAVEGEPKKTSLFNKRKKGEDTSNNIEVLGQGNQFVADGTHPSGVPYQWDYAPTSFTREHLTAISEQQIEELLDYLRPYIHCENALKNCCEELASTEKGQRDDTQNKLAYLMGGYVASGFIEKTRAIAKLFEAAIAAGRDESHTDDYIRGQLERSIEEGTAEPIQPPKKDQTAVDIISSIIGVAGDPAGQSLFANALVRLHGEDLRYDPKANLWFVWNEGKTFWQRNAEINVTKLVRDICDKVSVHLLAQDKKTDAASVTGIAFIKGVVQHAELISELWIDSSQFDSDKELLNTPEWAIELHGYAKREHRREDYCTAKAAVSPETGKPVQWLTYLSIALPADVAAFMKRWGGYCLSGLTHEQKLVFGFGPRGTGKTIFRETIRGIMGDYADVLGVGDLMETYGHKSTEAIAQTRGKRLLVCPEVSERNRWDEPLLKQLTGEDTVRARELYQASVPFKSQAKLMVSGNQKPGLRNVDDSMHERFLLVPYDKKPKPEEYVKDLQKQLEAEWPMILNWFIEGYQEYLREGLNPPESIRVATNEYFEDEDELKQVLEELCVYEPKASIAIAKLHDAVTSYAKKKNIWQIASIKKSQMSKRLEQDERLRKDRMNNGTWCFYGITLKSFENGWENGQIFDASNVAPIWPPLE